MSYLYSDILLPLLSAGFSTFCFGAESHSSDFLMTGLKIIVDKLNGRASYNGPNVSCPEVEIRRLCFDGSWREDGSQNR